MVEPRETFFRCTFTSPATHRVAHVRAWDAGEAVQLFRIELRTDGVEERGTIEVADLGGVVTARGDYGP